jgi:hypothetical protein
LYELEPGREVRSSQRQEDDDVEVVADLGLGALIYDWRHGRPTVPLPFQVGHHVWEVYRLPEPAVPVAHDALEHTTRRQAHWLVDWPGRDRVLVRRPPDLEPPRLRGWDRLRRDRELQQQLADSEAARARLDRALERVEVLEPLYVERARLRGRDWTRTVALLPDGEHVAMCPWDWYDIVVDDFARSCAEAVRRERER